MILVWYLRDGGHNRFKAVGVEALVTKFANNHLRLAIGLSTVLADFAVMTLPPGAHFASHRQTVAQTACVIMSTAIGTKELESVSIN